MRKTATLLLMVMLIAATATTAMASFYGNPGLLHGDWEGSISIAPAGGSVETSLLAIEFGPVNTDHDPTSYNDGYFWLPATTPAYPSHSPMLNTSPKPKQLGGYQGTYTTLTTFFDGTNSPLGNPYATADNLISYAEQGGTVTSDQGQIVGRWSALLWAIVSEDLNSLAFQGSSSIVAFGNTTDYEITGILTRAATPIPGAIWLLGSGVAGLIGLRRKMKA